ncbi:hypothetical protein [Parasitella parasitica]|uniref:Reverse transcriptase/retrotransposon-derived protein RNase H-like domain-containing protein n=1 Tax=Parasitella parasitica TaxID=35722 RepID=A0A0B7MXU8_9FUNG|nr:hypothetical protein [Parasitella parasitica]
MKYLGFCNYFRNVVPGFSELAGPLDELRNLKSLDGLWTDRHTKAFNTLKQVLSSSVALSPIDFRYKLHVATDASSTDIGGILYYIKGSVVHYVTMASRKLSKSEMANSTTKRELLAIVYMFTRYHKWLFGTPFVLHTDHRSLVWLQTQTTPNMMLLTWYEVIFFHYNYEIFHIPGSRNLLPDALSRLFDTDVVDTNVVEKGDRYNNKSIMVEEKKRKAKESGRLITAKNRKYNRCKKMLKPNRASKPMFKHKGGMRQSSSSVAANRDPIYYKSVNEDIDIYDARTYANLLPSSSSVRATEDDPTNQGSSYDLDDCDDNSENVETTTHGNTALIARAMKYTDYMTPPKDERLELILRVHLLGSRPLDNVCLSERAMNQDKPCRYAEFGADQFCGARISGND